MATTDANPPMPEFRTDYVLQEVDGDYLAKAVKPTRTSDKPPELMASTGTGASHSLWAMVGTVTDAAASAGSNARGRQPPSRPCRLARPIA